MDRNLKTFGNVSMNVSGIRHVTVVGAGTLGAGIAGLFARAGYAVRLTDLKKDFLARGIAMVRSAQEALRKARLLTNRDSAAALKRIALTTDLEAACTGADLVVEAVTENIHVKTDMFRRFGALCPKHAILASNTSGLSISKIASATRRPKQVAGLHFWNPPHIIPLVEVTKGRHTSDSTAQALVRLCRRIGKEPVLVRHDVPGFVGNRLQFAVLREALHILEEGIASAEDIDTAMTAGPGLRYGLLGPLRTADLGGLDVFLAISRYLFPKLSATGKASPVMEHLVKTGRLGTKTGCGFYRYTPAEKARIIARRDAVLLAFLKTLKESKRR